MSVLVDQHTRVVVQGITGREGLFHTRQMTAYGTQVVAGVTPGKGGEWADGVPVFDTCKLAVEATAANCALIFVPARFAADAMLEAWLAVDALAELLLSLSNEGVFWVAAKLAAEATCAPSCKLGPATDTCDA